MTKKKDVSCTLFIYQLKYTFKKKSENGTLFVKTRLNLRGTCRLNIQWVLSLKQSKRVHLAARLPVNLHLKSLQAEVEQTKVAVQYQSRNNIVCIA